MQDTIFTKIIQREIPADILYEDEHALAFLDINPNSVGHTLVVPKKPFVNIFDIDDETLTRLMHAVRIVALALQQTLQAEGMHINSNHGAAAGQEVFHFHFHLIPRHARSEFAFDWARVPYEKEKAAALAASVRTLLSR